MEQAVVELRKNQENYRLALELLRESRIKLRNAVRKEICMNSGISNREEAVLGFVRDGLMNKEIADILGVRERTIKFHVSSLLRKTGVSNRREL